MRHLGRWLLWTFALLAAAFILLQGWYAAHIWWWREHAPRETAFMAMRLAELQERRPDARLAYRWVGYDGISVALKRVRSGWVRVCAPTSTPADARSRTWSHDSIDRRPNPAGGGPQSL